MSKKVAKLVYFSLMTRVVVDEDATDDDIIKACYPKIQAKIDNRELGDNLEEIDDDGECPAGTFIDDVYYQPEFINGESPVGINGVTIHSFQVFTTKEKAKKVFPDSKVLEFSGIDIEEPEFVA